MVWKHECNETRNGGFSGRARTRFSVIVHSTSSSWIITSFFRILMANSSFVTLCSPNKTWILKYSRIRTYTTRLYTVYYCLYATFFWLPKWLLHWKHDSYMQPTDICNFFVVPEQLHISLFYCILLYMQLFPGSRFSEVLKALIFLRVYATRLYATFLWLPSSCI